MTTKASDLGPPRWRGQPHRLEVWYATFTDPRTTDGYWLHHEMVAPDEGAPYAHGWCAVFPFDGPPRGERFGPAPPDPGGDAWFSAAGAHVDGAVLRGAAGDITWDLAYADTSAPLYTFPSWSWEKEVLPASQVIAMSADPGSSVRTMKDSSLVRAAEYDEMPTYSALPCLTAVSSAPSVSSSGVSGSNRCE